MWLEDRCCSLPRFKKTAKNHKAWSKIAAWETEQQYQDVFIYLTNLFLNLFKWNNLPETCNELALERTLYFYGRAIFFQDSEPWSNSKYTVSKPENGSMYWHTPVMLSYGLNIYYEHIQRTAYSFNFNKELNITNSVLIRANRLMHPFYLTVMLYAEKIVQAARTIDVTAENMKNPFIVQGEESEIDSINAFFDRIRNNEGAILTTKNFTVDGVNVVPVGQASRGGILTDMWDHKHQIINEILTRMGINNANADKKERLLTDEVNANDQLITDSIKFMLDSRKTACKQINEMFGLNLSVELNVDKAETEVGENGDVYSGTTRAD